MKPNNRKEALTTRCPACKKKVTYKGMDKNPFFPFCCRRCKLIDLDKWLEEEHQIRTPIDRDRIE